MDQPLQNANTDEQTADEIRDRLVGSRQTQFVPSTEGSSDPTAAPPDYIASELGRHGAHLKLLHEVLGETYRGWKQLDSDVDAIDDKTARAFRALQAKTDRRFCDLQSSIAVTQSSLASLQSTVSQLVNDRLNDRYADTVVLDSQSWADTAKSAATSLAKTAACAIAIPIAASAAGSAFEVGRWITRDRLNQVSA